MWTDIGWNWLIGTDGRVYEGRGWGATGSHSAGYNYISYGIAFVGNYTEYETSKIPLAVAEGTHDLLQCAVRLVRLHIFKVYNIFACKKPFF